jgi:hypothetical protein
VAAVQPHRRQLRVQLSHVVRREQNDYGLGGRETPLDGFPAVGSCAVCFGDKSLPFQWLQVDGAQKVKQSATRLVVAAMGHSHDATSTCSHRGIR